MLPSPRAPVWDLPVRIFHWSTAALFLTNFWLLEAGENLHEWTGYAIGALLVLRVVWGFVGSTNARFRSFWPTPARLRAHAQQLRSRRFDEDAGHNPVGALMVLFMIALLATVVISGWMQELDRFWGEDWVQSLHEYAADTLMVAVCIHVLGVLAMSRISGQNLVRAMLTGRRSRH